MPPKKILVLFAKSGNVSNNVDILDKSKRSRTGNSSFTALTSIDGFSLKRSAIKYASFNKSWLFFVISKELFSSSIKDTKN